MGELANAAKPFPNVLRKELAKVSAFLAFFVLTLGFEIQSNAILLGILPFYLNRLKFHKELFFSIVLLLFLFILFFTMTQNSVYFKYWIIALRMIILVSFFNYLFQKELKALELRPIIEKIFYAHVCCIIICFISPATNRIITGIFAYSVRETNFRVSGFFSGFDIVSFFILIYLAYEYLSSRKVLSASLLLKLLLGAFAIFLSGRFGIIPLTVFVFYILVKFKNIKWVLLAVPIIVAILASSVLDKRIDNIKSTFNMLEVAVKDLEKVDNSFFEGNNIEGQYNQSPLTWYFEFIKPFKKAPDYLFPGKQDLVDSGPAFFVLNFGIILSIFLYVLYFRIFNLSTKTHIPFIVVVIFLVADMKFRLLYSLMPIVWLSLNHFSYVQQVGKFKQKSQ